MKDYGLNTTRTTPHLTCSMCYRSYLSLPHPCHWLKHPLFNKNYTSLNNCTSLDWLSIPPGHGVFQTGCPAVCFPYGGRWKAAVFKALCSTAQQESSQAGRVGSPVPFPQPSLPLPAPSARAAASILTRWLLLARGSCISGGCSSLCGSGATSRGGWPTAFTVTELQSAQGWGEEYLRLSGILGVCLNSVTWVAQKQPLRLDWYLLYANRFAVTNFDRRSGSN